MFQISHNQKTNLARKWVSLLVLVSVLLAVTPIPIGWKPKIRAGSEPFPCQDCSCGCVTPEQCWTNCCCFSPVERLAWAQKNGVEPPIYAVLDKGADERTSVACQPEFSPEPSSQCCCCCSNGSPQENESQPANDLSDRETEPTTPRSVVMLSMTAIKCRGGCSQFTMLPWAVVENEELDFSFPEPVVRPFVVEDEWLPSVEPQLEDPPPRLGVDHA